jgi:molybdenum cofactor cytidylyltransferase
MLSAVVLAAGESRRMGRHLKALLPLQGRSFLAHILRNLGQSDVDELLVVLGYGHELIEREVDLSAARTVVNEKWPEGQLSSLRAAVEHLSPESEAMLFHPVDQPLVRPSTFNLLIEEWKRHRNRIVLPSHVDRKGHPAIFPSRLYEALLHDRLEGGARDLIYREMKDVHFVRVADPGVIQDIDTPEDYTYLIGELP